VSAPAARSISARFALAAALAYGQAAHDPQAVLGAGAQRGSRRWLKPGEIRLRGDHRSQLLSARDAPPSPGHAAPPPACAPPPPNDPYQLATTDRVRLEVTVSEGSELHSWPGATRFDERNVDDLIRNGPVSTGSFGAYLNSIFGQPGSCIPIQGRANRQRQNVVRVRLSACRWRPAISRSRPTGMASHCL
jgi:hypothetical protein